MLPRMLELNGHRLRTAPSLMRMNAVTSAPATDDCLAG